MVFGDVLEGAKQGREYARAGWNGRGMRVGLVGPLAGMRAYLYLIDAQGQRVPWTIDHTSALADDWYEVV
jgi:hypothetical protein